MSLNVRIFQSDLPAPVSTQVRSGIAAQPAGQILDAKINIVEILAAGSSVTLAILPGLTMEVLHRSGTGLELPVNAPAGTNFEGVAAGVPWLVPDGGNMKFVFDGVSVWFIDASAAGVGTGTGGPGGVTRVVGTAPLTGTVTGTGAIGINIGSGLSVTANTLVANWEGPVVTAVGLDLAINAGTIQVAPSKAVIGAGGSNQAAAVTLTARVNFVNPGTATANYLTPGTQDQRIINRGSVAALLWPAAGISLDGINTGTAAAIAAGGAAELIIQSGSSLVIV